MDFDELSHQRTLLNTHRKRIRILEGNVAKFGQLYAPPHLLLDLDETKEAARQAAQRIEALSAMHASATVGAGEEATVAKRFDVFLCHNSQDKPAVKNIGLQLKARGVLPWLDEWELRPGLPWQPLLDAQLERVASAAVFVGASGIGPWQNLEVQGFLNEFVERRCPVIPVLLSDSPVKPELPKLLKLMTWVDFKLADPDPLDRLIFGITGRQGAG